MTTVVYNIDYAEISDIEDFQRMLKLMKDGVSRHDMLDRRLRYDVRTTTVRRYHAAVMTLLKGGEQHA